MDADDFLAVVAKRIAKKSANEVYSIVRRAASELLGYVPRIVMHEVQDKRPPECIVIELDGDAGGLAIHFQGQFIEFR